MRADERPGRGEHHGLAAQRAGASDHLPSVEGFRGLYVAVWEIGFEGETFEWDDESLMLSEARELKKWLKVAPPQWLKMLGEDDPEAATALICLLRRRAGQPDLRFADVDGDLKTLTFTLREGEDEDQETPDPTPDVT
jgi:hypothetical protein